MLRTRRVTRARARGLQLISQLLLAVQLLSLCHLLSVHHVTCLEHGDIIHVDHDEGAAPDPGKLGEDDPLRRSLAPANPAVGAEHEHCRVCADTGRRCLLPVPAKSFSPQVPVARGVPAVSSTGFTRIELILLSPKNSPPSA